MDKRKDTLTTLTETKAKLNLLRQTHPEFRGLSDEQLGEMLQQAMQEQTPQAGESGAADLERMSMQELAALCERMMDMGRWQEAERWTIAMLEKAEKVDDPKGQCRAITLLGELCRERGEYPQAMTLFQRALRLADQLGDWWQQGVICDDIATTYRYQGQYPQAIEHYKKSSVIAEKNGDERMLAVECGNLGTAYEKHGKLDLAIEAYEKALATFLKLGDQLTVSMSYGNIAIIYTRQGRYDLAEEMYHKSLAITKGQGYDEATAINYINLGKLYTTKGALEDAIRIYEKALEMTQHIGDERGVAEVYSALGGCYKLKGDTASTLDFYRKSMDILERIGAHHNSAVLYFNLGCLYNDDIRNPTQARAHFEKAKALFEMVGDTAGVQHATQALLGRRNDKIPVAFKAQLDYLRNSDPVLASRTDDQLVQQIQETRQTLQAKIAHSGVPDDADMESSSSEKCQLVGEILQEIGRLHEAERWSLLAVEKAENEGNLMVQCAGTIILGRLRRNRGEIPQAMSLYQHALALSERIGDERQQGVIIDQIGSVYLAQNQYSKANEHFRKCLKIAEKIDDEGTQAVAYGNLGIAYMKRGDFSSGIEAQNRSVALYLKTGNEQGAAKSYGNLGSIYYQQGSNDQAIDMYRKSLEISERLGLEQGMAINYTNLGLVKRNQQAYGEAIRMFKVALPIAQRVGEDSLATQISSLIADCHKAIGSTGA